MDKLKTAQELLQAALFTMNPNKKAHREVMEAVKLINEFVSSETGTRIDYGEKWLRGG